MARIGSSSGNSQSTSTGNVSGVPPTDVNAIARWDNTSGTVIKNSPNTYVQDGGAIQASGFITTRSVTTLVVVPSGDSMIAPNLEIELSGSLEIEPDGELIII